MGRLDDQTIIIVAIAVAATIGIYVAVLFERRRRFSRPSRPPGRPAPALVQQSVSPAGSVRALRRLGFFAGEPSSDGELARRLVARIEVEWGDSIAAIARTPAQLDVLLALHDTRRGCRVPDKYFYPGEDSCLEIIAMCARLDGVARIEPLREEWTRPEGPVSVRFLVDGQESSYTIADPKYVGPGLVDALNAATTARARRLRVSDALGMPNSVFALTDEEADTLVRDRGWRFHEAAGARRT